MRAAIMAPAPLTVLEDENCVWTFGACDSPTRTGTQPTNSIPPAPTAADTSRLALTYNPAQATSGGAHATYSANADLIEDSVVVMDRIANGQSVSALVSSTNVSVYGFTAQGGVGKLWDRKG